MQDTAKPSKRSVELAIDASLLELAEARDLDLAEVLEQAIRRKQMEPALPALELSAEEWCRENAEAIQAWNDGLRSF